MLSNLRTRSSTLLALTRTGPSVLSTRSFATAAIEDDDDGEDDDGHGENAVEPLHGEHDGNEAKDAGDPLALAHFDISARTVTALMARGIDELFPVQATTYDTLRTEQRDLVCRSLTGSGKTLAFALPIVESLHEADNAIKAASKAEGRKARRPTKPRALVLAPTRELANQVGALLRSCSCRHRLPACSSLVLLHSAN